jgi:hypothetical protein
MLFGSRVFFIPFMNTSLRGETLFSMNLFLSLPTP